MLALTLAAAELTKKKLKIQTENVSAQLYNINMKKHEKQDTIMQDHQKEL